MTWYGPAVSKWFLAVLGSAWIVGLGVLATLATTPARELGLGVAGAVLVALWVRCARLGIGVDRNTCVVRNVLRTHSLPNDKIVDIRSGSPWWLVLATKGTGAGTCLYLDVMGRRRGLWVSAGLLDGGDGSDAARASVVATVLDRDARVDRPVNDWQSAWDDLSRKQPD